MGRGKGFATEERRATILLALTEKGMALWEVRKAVREQFRISDRTFRRDVEELGKRARAELMDPALVDVEVAGCIDRLRAVAVAAALLGTASGYQAAISANRALLRFLGARDDRWARVRDEDGFHVEVNVETSEASIDRATMARVRELETMTTEQLAARSDELRERLRLVEGGRPS